MIARTIATSAFSDPTEFSVRTSSGRMVQRILRPRLEIRWPDRYLIQGSWIQATREAHGFLVTAECPMSH
jgi:hypothetical protein